MFVGRTELLDLVDRLVEVSVPSPELGSRPILVVEGCGGSGRTALLKQARLAWRGRTPTVLVHPREHIQARERAIRPVLTAVMLGLSEVVPNYSLSFERVLLAQIAIATDTSGLDHAAALDKLREATNSYRARSELAGLVRGLITVAGDSVAGAVGPGALVVPAVADQLADYVVRRLQRSRWTSRLTWSPAALAWFGHQGQDLHRDGEHVRLELNARAGSDDPVVRRSVDDVLVGALLADLRYSLADMANRPANVLVLLDDGDVPSATTFIGALLRVRRALAETRTGPDGELPDPLTLITTSGGALADELTGPLPAPIRCAKPVSADISQTMWWLRVSLPDLHVDNVIQLAKNHMWTGGLMAETVGVTIHGLTNGHPRATREILDRLRDDSALIQDLNRLLGGAGPERGVALDHHLLGLFIRGLTVAGHDDDDLREALITVSAARNLLEAQRLPPLLPPLITLDSVVLGSPTLWWPSDAPSEVRLLHPLARYLGLRALAVRAETHPASWPAVFRLLRDAAGSDQKAVLHHRRLLGEREAVAAELAGLLPVMQTEEWLELFDAVVSTPDLRERRIEVIRGEGQDGTPRGHVFRMLGVVPAIESDPCITDAAVLEKLRAHEAQGYGQIADVARDSAPLILRGRRRGRYGGGRT